MRFDILTLFPDMFPGYLGQSLLKKAIDAGLVEVRLHDIRKWTRDKHLKVDDRPFGGGPGMVMMVEPVVECVEAVQGIGRAAGPPGDAHASRAKARSGRRGTVGRAQADRAAVREIRRFRRARDELLKPEEISIGDYVLNGGEVAAMVIIDAVIRLVPGVLGDAESSRSDSFSTASRLLEFAQYTRPREFRGLEVPEILLSGDHGEIARWREENSRQRTEQWRSDLL